MLHKLEEQYQGMFDFFFFLKVMFANKDLQVVSSLPPKLCFLGFFVLFLMQNNV